LRATAERSAGRKRESGVSGGRDGDTGRQVGAGRNGRDKAAATESGSRRNGNDGNEQRIAMKRASVITRKITWIFMWAAGVLRNIQSNPPVAWAEVLFT
jgi:hypothetical protein